MYSAIHLELARQRQRDLLAEAERRRAANGFRNAGVTAAARRSQRQASARQPHSTPDLSSHADVEVGFEV
jgi:hypothetical protein